MKDLELIIVGLSEKFLLFIGKIFSYVLPIGLVFVSFGVFSGASTVEDNLARIVLSIVAIIIFIIAIILFVGRKKLFD